MCSYYLAIDLGASSGRHVIGYKKNKNILLREIYRFQTGMDDTTDGKTWDLDRIFNEIKKGIKMAFESYPNIKSLSIDTWGVDYVLMNGDKEIKPFYAYRNERCLKACEEVHKIIPFEEIYKTTGIQFASFNTIYQLFDDYKKGRLTNATDYLMLPSYFTYKLTGIKVEIVPESRNAALPSTIRLDEVYYNLPYPQIMFSYRGGSNNSQTLSEVKANNQSILLNSNQRVSRYWRVYGMTTSYLATEENVFFAGAFTIRNEYPVGDTR